MNRDDYLYLRLKISFNELIQRVKALELNPDEVLILNEEVWSAFIDMRLHNGEMAHLQKEPRYELNLEDSKVFKDTNYLWDDQLFKRLSLLAKQERIESHQIDLQNSVQVFKLIAGIQNFRLRVSVLDISNAWHPQYTSLNNLEFLVKSMIPVSTKDTILLLTNYADQKSKDLYPNISSNIWNYFGFKFDNFYSEGAIHNFFKHILNLHEIAHNAILDIPLNSSILCNSVL
jgi:hypothetical protein